MAPGDERTRRIVDVLMALQPGEVTTYGDVAETAGYPRQSRLVGRILATTDLDLPWWRVVNAAGRLVPGNERTQAELLTDEDVTEEDVTEDEVTDEETTEDEVADEADSDSDTDSDAGSGSDDSDSGSDSGDSGSDD